MKYTPIFLSSLAILLVFSCRPRPEEGEAAEFHATAPDEQGLSTLTTSADVLWPSSQVTLTNSSRDEVHYASSSSDGSLLYALPASSGEIIDIAYTDAGEVSSTVTLAIPLQAISIHGRVVSRDLANGCFAFERDDLVDSDLETESAEYELVGPVAEELASLAEHMGGDLSPMTLVGTPILFGLGACGSPLFEPEVYLSDDEAPPLSLHGRVIVAAGAGEDTCAAIGVTAELPIPPGTMGLEDEVLFSLLPVREEGSLFLEQAEEGAWVVITGRLLESLVSEDVPCGLRPFEPIDWWFDTGEGVDLEGFLTLVEDLQTEKEACWRFETSTPDGLSEILSLRGPLVKNLEEADQEGILLWITGYPTLESSPDTCGSPFTLAGYERLYPVDRENAVQSGEAR